jgi:hypothetical protein
LVQEGRTHLYVRFSAVIPVDVFGEFGHERAATKRIDELHYIVLPLREIVLPQNGAEENVVGRAPHFRGVGQFPQFERVVVAFIQLDEFEHFVARYAPDPGRRYVLVQFALRLVDRPREPVVELLYQFVLIVILDFGRLVVQRVARLRDAVLGA